MGLKKLIVIIFLIPLLASAQREEVLVRTDIFTVVYSEVLQQPLRVEYTVLCPNGTASRKGMDFYKNDSILTSDNADYANNVYDKGHLAPAAAFTCTPQMLRKTFSYLNCALQNQYLNRGTWRLLEAHERKLAATTTVRVEIILEFKGSTRLPTGATVPSGFYKKIKAGNKTSMYYFPNVRPTSSRYSDYEIKVLPGG